VRFTLFFCFFIHCGQPFFQKAARFEKIEALFEKIEALF